MKKLVLGLAFVLAVPAIAHAAEPEKKGCCCCEKDEHGKMKCCDEMKGHKHGEPGKDGHMGHDMPDKKG